MTDTPLTQSFIIEGLGNDVELIALKIISEVLSQLYGETSDTEACNRVVDFISSKFKDID